MAVAPAAAADDTVPWNVTTAANDYGSERTAFEYTVNAGDEVDDGIVVTNTGTAPLRLAVYGADAFTTAAGTLDLRPQGADSSGVGAWLRPGVDHVDVAPGGSADVPFTIALPADAAAGDHVGGIVTSATAAPGGSQGEQRVVIPVQLHVAGYFQPGLTVDALRTTYSGDDATVTYTLHNTGNAVLAARQDVAIGGPFGAFTVHADSVATTPDLLPGESWQVSVPVHGVTRAGWVSTTVALTPVYTDPAGTPSELDPVTSAAHAWALSWVAVLVVVVVLALLAGLVVLVVRLVRRPRRTATADPAAPGVQPVTSLSENLAHAASRKTTA